MGAAALTGRLPRARRARAAGATAGDTPLAFDARGGPMVAVCGLVGGAGTSTLAYLLARHAARHSSAPVLLAELHQQAGLAALAGTGSPLALRDLARAVVEQRSVERPFAALESGLRVVACAHSERSEPVPPAALGEVLAHAREAHGLVVLDAGQAACGAETDALLQAASHVLFVLPATVTAMRRAQLLAGSGVLTTAADSVSTLAAIATHPGHGSPAKDLRRLAERYTDRLLLVPHIPELAVGRHENANGQLEGTFAALTTILRRQR